MNCLDSCVRKHTLFAKLATKSRLLNTTKWNAKVRVIAAVDPYHC